jgi:hypothetical protein
MHAKVVHHSGEAAKVDMHATCSEPEGPAQTETEGVRIALSNSRAQPLPREAAGRTMNAPDTTLDNATHGEANRVATRLT